MLRSHKLSSRFFQDVPVLYGLSVLRSGPSSRLYVRKKWTQLHNVFFRWGSSSLMTPTNAIYSPFSDHLMITTTFHVNATPQDVRVKRLKNAAPTVEEEKLLALPVTRWCGSNTFYNKYSDQRIVRHC